MGFMGLFTKKDPDPDPEPEKPTPVPVLPPESPRYVASEGQATVKDLGLVVSQLQVGQGGWAQPTEIRKCKKLYLWVYMYLVLERVTEPGEREGLVYIYLTEDGLSINIGYVADKRWLGYHELATYQQENVLPVMHVERSRLPLADGEKGCWKHGPDCDGEAC